MSGTILSGSRRPLALLALLVAGVVAAACAPMPTAPTTTTTTLPTGWPGASCFDGTGTDGTLAPDLAFNGTPNVLGNTTISVVFSGGGFLPSGNGTCAGVPVASLTIVRAPDAGAADILCVTAGAGGVSGSFTGSPWTLPADAWACDDAAFF